MSSLPNIADESGDNYKFGFVTDIASDIAPKGLNEDIIRLISQKKEEPAFGFPAQSLSEMADDDRADMGKTEL